MAADELEVATGERATIRLVAEMVKGVSSQVTGLRDLTESQFADVQRQLDNVTGLPLIVTGMIEHSKGQDARLDDLEAERDTGREWRRGPLLTAAIGLLTVAANVVLLVIFH